MKGMMLMKIILLTKAILLLIDTEGEVVADTGNIITE